MTSNPRLEPHIYLFDMMAERLEKNLAAAVVEDKISTQEVLEGAFRCSGCAQAASCAAILPKTESLETPFRFCRNRALFAKL